MELVNFMGFDAVDAGALDKSWRQQPSAPVYTADLDIAGLREALRKATRERKPEWRATPKGPGTFVAPARSAAPRSIVRGSVILVPAATAGHSLFRQQTVESALLGLAA